MATQIQIVVSGTWLGLNCLYGDVEMSTSSPGGSDELSWALGVNSTCRFEGGEIVQALYGGYPIWYGTLLEPDPSQDRLTAQGMWRQGEKYAALSALGNTIRNPDTAIDNAIASPRFLQWTRPNSISGAAVDVDVSEGPVTLGGLLDKFAENNGVRWGVNGLGQVYAAADATAPSYQTVPMAGGLGYALDDYASTLICRYFDSATSTFKTLPAVTDAVAESLHGHAERVVDLTDRAAITSTTATSIANSILTLGASTPQWTASLELSYGELLNMGGVPVALETVAAGSVVRVYGGFELTQRQNNVMYVDVLIGRTNLADGVLTLQPMQIASRTFTDVLTAAFKKAA